MESRYKHANENFDVMNMKFNVEQNHDATVNKYVSCINLEVIRCQSIGEKLVYVFDHFKDCYLDIVTLTERSLFNVESKDTPTCT